MLTAGGGWFTVPEHDRSQRIIAERKWTSWLQTYQPVKFLSSLRYSSFNCCVIKGLRMVARPLWRSEAHRVVTWSETCTSGRRVQGRSQDTTLSASDLHNALATILNPFYHMEYKINKKIRQNTMWIEVDILGINLTPNQYNAFAPAMTSQSHSTPWRRNSNTMNVTVSAHEWGWNRFEIYGLALELISISLCTWANTWTFGGVYFKGNQMKLFQ